MQRMDEEESISEVQQDMQRMDEEESITEVQQDMQKMDEEESISEVQQDMPIMDEERSIRQVQQDMQRMDEERSIRQVQQELAENCGFTDKIIWDLLASHEGDLLKNKIKQLIPDQEKRQKHIEEKRDIIFQNVWAQRKYTNHNSLTNIIYVMVTDEMDFNKASDSTTFSCHPLFRSRKCTREDVDSSSCCMIFVDEAGRVYKNWNAFIEENVLPAGTLVAPHNGIYNFDSKNEVILDVYRIPAGTTGAKAMNYEVFGANYLVPSTSNSVADPLLVAAAVVRLGVGAFTAVTSFFKRKDHNTHEQSTSITDKQARASYLGIAGGVLGAAGAGAGVANGVLDLIFKFKDGDDITTLDVLQLSASLVLFTHSVYNFQLASQLANEARMNSISKYRETLSNRQRRMFDKMSKETIRIRGDTKGKIDIIRNVNEIPDRQYLNDLFKINKQLNSNEVRPAFGSANEGVVLNNELPVDTNILRQSVQHQQGPNILEQVTQPIPNTHNPENLFLQNPTSTSKSAHLLFTNVDDKSLTLTDAARVRHGEDAARVRHSEESNVLDKIFEYGVLVPESGLCLNLQQYGKLFLDNIADGHKLEDILLSMANNFSEATMQYVMRLTQKFFELFLNEIQSTLKIFLPSECILYRIMKFILENYTNLTCDDIRLHDMDIMIGVKTYYLSLSTSNDNKNKIVKCDDCKGSYFVCNL